MLRPSPPCNVFISSVARFDLNPCLDGITDWWRRRIELNSSNQIGDNSVPLLISQNTMATYIELKQRAEKLMAEAEEMRQKETNDVIAEIREKMKAYGLTAQDIGGSGAPRQRSSGSAKTRTVKYRSPNGETWSGGRGRKPRWVQEALKAGKKIEDFAV
jgi:DNA-binding protein H-NS